MHIDFITIMLFKDVEQAFQKTGKQNFWDWKQVFITAYASKKMLKSCNPI